MVRQNLPIYAKTRAAAGRSTVLRARAPGEALPQIILPAAPTLPAPARALYQVNTHAGKVDTVWHASSHGPKRPLPVPVWRSGYRDGLAGRALFNKPTGLAVDPRGRLYVADSLNHCIRRISPGGRVTTLAGNGERGHVDARGRSARFNHPTGLALSPRQDLYVVDQGNRLLRCLGRDGTVRSLAPCGAPLGGIAVDAQGLIYLMLGLRFGGREIVGLGRLDPASGETWLLADWEGGLQWLAYRSGDEEQPFSRWWLRRGQRPLPFEIATAAQGEGLGLAIDARGTLVWLAGSHLYRLDAQLQLQRQALRLDLWPLARWQGLSVDGEGTVHVLDARHHSLWRIRQGAEPEQVMSAGLEGLYQPYSVVHDGYGRLYVSDTGHWRVCRLVPPGREALLRLARLAFMPYFAAQQGPSPKGIRDVVDKHLGRKPAPPRAAVPVIAEAHVLGVLAMGNRSQQLALVKELVDELRMPNGVALPPLHEICAALLAHPDAAVRTLLVRHLCDTVHDERDALFWIHLLDQHRESNRLLKKYLIEVLVFLGRRFELYGHVVPLLVEYIRAPEEDVVEHVFTHLLAIRRAGYESLVDPLIEELGRANDGSAAQGAVR